ncbi:MAG: hypothetical protein ABSG11_03585, partial [Candidatus Korobacteraceae bacterium]
PRLLRVTLESIHHRQCPLLHLAVNVAGFAAEKESLIRVSLRRNSRQAARARRIEPVDAKRHHYPEEGIMIANQTLNREVSGGL